MINAVDQYILGSEKWVTQLNLLRAILLDCGLKEEMKWGIPMYTLNARNIIGLAAFKSYAGLWFHQGVFLTDAANVLVSGSESTKGLRQWRFLQNDKIDADLVKSYVMEAVANAKAGKEIKAEKKQLTLPVELHQALSSDAILALAFDALSHSKRMEYAEYICSVKQEITRIKRLEKCIPIILNSKGLNERYR